MEEPVETIQVEYGRVIFVHGPERGTAIDGVPIVCESMTSIAVLNLDPRTGDILQKCQYYTLRIKVSELIAAGLMGLRLRD
jgi:hypothetical protein